MRAEFSDLCADRSALAHIGACVVAVPDAVPGDVAEIELRGRRGAVYRGHLLTLVRPSPHRVRPLCPLFDRCGGCQWQRVDLNAQVEHKGALVRAALDAVNHGGIPVRTTPAAVAWEHRTAGTYVPIMTGVHAPALGLHAAAGPFPIPVDRCLIQSLPLQSAFEQTTQAWRALAPLLRENGSDATACRQVRIRVGEASQEAAVGLVLDKPPTPRQRDAIIREMRAHVSRLVEIAAIASPPAARRLDSIDDVRWGHPGIVEAMMGYWYQAPVFAPFPVTGRAASDAITSAIDALDLNDETALLETDAGIGAYTLPAAAAARRVVGRTASEHLSAAKHNAAWNEVANVVFVDRSSQTLAATVRAHGPIQRALIHLTQERLAFDTLYEAGVQRVVLLTTSPSRLADAVAAADAADFHAQSVAVIDTHPQTSRAELHAVLEARRRAWGGAKLRAVPGRAKPTAKARRSRRPVSSRS
jgi:23S rRNA (uracil1939-C5)-methyltransferase